MRIPSCRSSAFSTAIPVLAAFLCAVPARAEYQYTVIDYPGAIRTALFGVSNSGRIVGNASVDPVSSFSFVYDGRKGLFEPLPTIPGADFQAAFGINSTGVIAGSVTYLGPDDAQLTQATVFDRGAYSFIEYPGSGFTEFRAINNRGLITGWADDLAAGVLFGFIYDPRTGTFIDIRFEDSFVTLAQGINSRGDVVGSTLLLASGAFPGSLSGHYGFLRSRQGSMSLFRVNGVSTRARGITDSGHIVGWLQATASGPIKGFATRLEAGSDFQALAIPDGELLEVPGALQTYPQDIDSSGRIVGSWVDSAGVQRGFIATPIRH